MGVQGLWELLAPVGRRVSVDTLGNKKLAIDASIWIVQFLKAMRDERGEVMRNAHLLGFFRRICKLLYLKVKPVFVFDGGTPFLKRRTVIARRRQREQAQAKIRKTAEKLLLNQLRARRIEELVRDEGNAETVQENGTEKASTASTSQRSQEDSDALLAASLQKEWEKEDEPVDLYPDSEGEVHGILPAVGGKVDSAVLAALPPSMQLRLLDEMREHLVAENRQKFSKVAKAPASFSELQIQAYLKTVAFRREIVEVQKSTGNKGIGGVPSTRIASEVNREFIFSSHEDNRSEPVVENRSTGSDLTTAVSSQLLREPENPSEVQTYIDRKGKKRVSRVRGMGVRMTRDLQWNLYLMKDKEQNLTASPNDEGQEDSVFESLVEEPAGFTGEDNEVEWEDEQVEVEAGESGDKNLSTSKSGIQVTFEDGPSEDPDEEMFRNLVICSKTTDATTPSSDKVVRVVLEDNGTPDPDDAMFKKLAASSKLESDDEEIEWEENAELQDKPQVQEHSEKVVCISSGSEDNVNEDKEGRKIEEVEEEEIEWEENVVSEFQDKPQVQASQVQSEVVCISSGSEDNVNEDKEGRKIEEVGEREIEWEENVVSELQDKPQVHASQAQSEVVCISSVSEDNANEDKEGGKAEEVRGQEQRSGAVASSTAISEEHGHEFKDLKCSTAATAASNSNAGYAEEQSELEEAIRRSLLDYGQQKAYKPLIIQERVDDAPNVVEGIGGKGKEVVDEDVTATNGNASDSSRGRTRYRGSSSSGVGREKDTAVFSEPTQEVPLMATEAEEEFLRSEESYRRQAELYNEREVLFQEEAELRAEQKRNERNAESVTNEMFAECQELLQLFGIPYVVAPMEAEAQCAFMDTANLVDGVITDDSDVFLFGGCSVYKNIFDGHKYVETYLMKDVQSELGLTRDKLIRMAMLLGSDYTEGVSGIGIVNAIEVVNAFPDENGLTEFKEWVNSPDLMILNKFQPRKGRNGCTGQSESAEGNGTGTEDRKQMFMLKHRAVSKNWSLPPSFPSKAVLEAYTSPQVDKSTETFTWGRPDLHLLKKFCWEKLGWNQEKADELLLPVLREFDRRETQLRLDAFFSFNERFAKIRSRRIQKAVADITGRRDSQIMAASVDVNSAPRTKRQRRPKASTEEAKQKRTRKRANANETEAGPNKKQGNEAQKPRRTRKKARTVEVAPVQGNGGAAQPAEPEGGDVAVEESQAHASSMSFDSFLSEEDGRQSSGGGFISEETRNDLMNSKCEDNEHAGKPADENEIISGGGSFKDNSTSTFLLPEDGRSFVPPEDGEMMLLAMPRFRKRKS